MSRSHVYFAKGVKPSFTKYTLLDLSGFESTNLPPPIKTHQHSWWRSTGKVDSMARFPGESGKEKTSVRTGFANMPPACWI